MSEEITTAQRWREKAAARRARGEPSGAGIIFSLCHTPGKDWTTSQREMARSLVAFAGASAEREAIASLVKGLAKGLAFTREAYAQSLRHFGIMVAAMVDFRPPDFSRMFGIDMAALARSPAAIAASMTYGPAPLNPETALPPMPESSEVTDLGLIDAGGAAPRTERNITPASTAYGSPLYVTVQGLAPGSRLQARRTPRGNVVVLRCRQGGEWGNVEVLVSAFSCQVEASLHQHDAEQAMLERAHARPVHKVSEAKARKHRAKRAERDN